MGKLSELALRWNNLVRQYKLRNSWFKEDIFITSTLSDISANKYNFGIKGSGKNSILVIFKETTNPNDYKG